MIKVLFGFMLPLSSIHTKRVSDKCFQSFCILIIMKIEKIHIDQIKAQFAIIQCKEDLVKLLSDAKNMHYGKVCKPFQLKALTYYSDPNRSITRYRKFTIKKKSGKERTIHAPAKGLKSILRSLNFVLQCIAEPHNAAYGFVMNKSIVDNAKVHVGNNYVYNIDLKDFFFSFDRKWVKYGFMIEPFELGKEREELAFFIACLCTHPLEVNGKLVNVLPQGSPTSPTITNILCKKLDKRLTGLANRFGAKYTRYADDITFSSPHNIYQKGEVPVLNSKGHYDNFTTELNRLLKEENLLINERKTRLQKSGYKQEVTGLIVNEKVNVKQRYVKQIRMWIYYWEKYGYVKAEHIFKNDYVADKGHVKKHVSDLKYVLGGKLEYLKMVKGEEDSTYKGLKKRFDKLLQIGDKQKVEESTNLEDLDNLLSKLSDSNFNLDLL